MAIGGVDGGLRVEVIWEGCFGAPPFFFAVGGLEIAAGRELNLRVGGSEKMHDLQRLWVNSMHLPDSRATADVEQCKQ